MSDRYVWHDRDEGHRAPVEIIGHPILHAEDREILCEAVKKACLEEGVDQVTADKIVETLLRFLSL